MSVVLVDPAAYSFLWAMGKTGGCSFPGDRRIPYTPLGMNGTAPGLLGMFEFASKEAGFDHRAL